MQKRLIAVIFIFSFLISPVFADKEDPMLEISKETVPGHTRIHKFGHLEDAGTSLEVIWSPGGNYNFTNVAELQNISSTDADDTVGGTGAWNITISGLDANWLPQSEVIQLNGQTPVQSVNTYIRVNRAFVLEPQATMALEATNEGDIYIGPGAVVAGVNANPRAFIGANYGQTFMAIYTIPANCTGYLETYTISTFTTNKEFEVYLAISEFELGNRRIEEYHLEPIEFQNDYVPPRPLQSKTDIWVMGEVDVGTGKIAVAFDIILVDDEFVNIDQTFKVNIVESIDLMSTEFFAFIILAAATMYFAWGTTENRKAGLGFAFSGLWWIAVMIQWVADHAGTTQIGIVWLFIAPLTFCFVMFMEKSWGQMDDATKTITERKNTF
jgi:hypothetical protein